MKLTKEKVQQIYSLAEEGFSDGEIAMITGAGLSAIQARTARYWRDKMDAAYSDNDTVINSKDLVGELLQAFKDNCSAFTLNKKDVTNLVTKCETFIKTQ